jgi:hypothetical protein
MSSTTITLTQRYELARYVRQLPSTIELRFAVDAFLQAVEFKDDEVQKYDIKVNPDTYEMECNDEDTLFDIGEVPAPVLKSMTEYIEALDTEEQADNLLLQKTFDAFRILVK